MIDFFNGYQNLTIKNVQLYNSNEEYKIAAYFGLVIITPLLSKHRGWTHSSLTMFLLSSFIG